MKFFLYSNDRQTGPYALDELRARAEAGLIRPADLVWREDWANWKTASEAPGLFTPPLPTIPPEDVPSRVRFDSSGEWKTAPPTALQATKPGLQKGTTPLPLEELAKRTRMRRPDVLLVIFSFVFWPAAIVALARWCQRLTYRVVLKRGCLNQYFLRIFLPSLWAFVWRSFSAVVLIGVCFGFVAYDTPEQAGSFLGMLVVCWLFALPFVMLGPLLVRRSVGKMMKKT